MFAYNLKTPRKLSAEQARHFNYTERRSLDWNNHATMVLLLAILMGSCAKTLDLPGMAVALTLLVAVAYVQDRPALDMPLWMGRLSLASTALFYAGLGYCLGVVGLIVVPALVGAHRAAFR